jgi:hypothetical protein
MIGLYEFMVMLGAVSPALLLWIAVIIFAAVMLRRGGGRAERFLIAGGGLKIISNMLGIARVFITPWLVDRGYSMDSAVSIASGYGIALNVIGMAGIACLIYAFWVKFQVGELRNIERAEEVTHQY